MYNLIMLARPGVMNSASNLTYLSASIISQVELARMKNLCSLKMCGQSKMAFKDCSLTLKGKYKIKQLGKVFKIAVTF